MGSEDARTESGELLNEKHALEALLDAGVSLTSELDIHKLLKLILARAQALTNADGGTLYLLDGVRLRAEVGNCRSLEERLGLSSAAKIFSRFEVPLDKRSIAGRAAVLSETVVLDDVRNPPPDMTYSDEFDVAHNYVTRSIMVVPMKVPDGTVVGVLQLINAQDASRRLVPFSGLSVRVVQALASQAAVAIRNAQLADQLRQSHLDALKTLGVAAEWRDRETANHIKRVAHYSALIARAAKLPEEEIEMIFHASPMHDVGKLGIPDAILQKPGKLDPDERRIMERHTAIGADIMKNDPSDVARLACKIALGHHEKWDGTGYPNKLAGETIPLCARIVALADVYDALCSRRCYKPAIEPGQVLAMIREQRGRHFDPALLDAFLEHLDEARAIGTRHVDTDDDLNDHELNVSHRDAR